MAGTGTTNERSYGSISVKNREDIEEQVKDVVPKKWAVVSLVALTFVVGSVLTSANGHTQRTASIESFPILGHSKLPFKLPKYLMPLPEDDPDFDYLTSSMYKYVLKEENLGGLKEAAVVTFTREHEVFRLYGGGDGKAGQCGRYWTLEAPKDDVPTYYEHFAVCPEWNDATFLIRCTVPVGFHAIVGPGQTAECKDGEILGSDGIMQLNGNVCDAIKGNLTCEWCGSDQFDLEKSACAADDVRLLF
jgi:hypothetical protein